VNPGARTCTAARELQNSLCLNSMEVKTTESEAAATCRWRWTLQDLTSKITANAGVRRWFW